jgi:hypothetical protein
MERTSLRIAVARASLALLCLLATVLVFAGAARADAIGPPPDTCPQFARGSSCHGGAYCAPAICSIDADCAAGESCRDVELCVGPYDCTSGYGTFTSEQTNGACAPGGCGLGACALRRVCAPGTARDAGTPRDAGPRADGGDTARVTKYGCGCTVPGGNATLGGLSLVVAALAGVALRRGRSRTPR